MLQLAKALAREGVAVHWLHPKTKRPRGDDWSTKPVNTPDMLERTFKEGFNVGIRLGEPSEIDDGLFLHCIDVDVKGDGNDAEEAYRVLGEILPDWKKFPFVESGRNTDSNHIYLALEEPRPSKKLAHSKRKVEWTDGAGKTHKSWAWEIELFGTGKQVAAPPSIHPDTGREYKWGREIDFDDLDSIIVDPIRLAPRDDDERPESASRSSTRDSDSGRSLSEIAASRKLDDVDPDYAWDILERLPFDEWCFDYEGWLKVGMALHHQFDGSQEGLDLWHDFSERADNYDADALDDKWKSFGRDRNRRPVRFGTLIQAATLEEVKRDLGGDDDTDWMSLLHISDKGLIRADPNNVRVVLQHDQRLKGLIGFNKFTDKKVLRAPPRRGKAGQEKYQAVYAQLDGPLWHFEREHEVHGLPILDDHVSAMRVMFTAKRKHGGWFGTAPTKLDINDAIASIARANEFHPVKEFLEELTWDGEERLDTLFIDWLGVEDTEYARQAARIFCVAAIARVYTPGIKFDCAPILEGAQGIGKSTFIRYLARDWFVELNCGFDDDKRIVETLRGRWIAELPELSQFGKSDVETVKAFFSAQSNVVRKAYAREEEEYPRQSVYMGSSNNDQYLRDETGNRRFWPQACRVKKIDLVGFKQIVPQIWAEAMVVYHEMCHAAGGRGRIFLDLQGAAATDAALKLQDSRRIETEADLWVGMIEEWFNEPVRKSEIDGNGSKFEKFDGDDPLVRREFLCVGQVWVEVLNGKLEALGRGNSNRVAAAISKLSCVEKAGVQRVNGYGVQRVWRRAKKTRRDLSDLI